MTRDPRYAKNTPEARPMREWMPALMFAAGPVLVMLVLFWLL